MSSALSVPKTSFRRFFAWLRHVILAPRTMYGSIILNGASAVCLNTRYPSGAVEIVKVIVAPTPSKFPLRVTKVKDLAVHLLTFTGLLLSPSHLTLYRSYSFLSTITGASSLLPLNATWNGKTRFG